MVRANCANTNTEIRSLLSPHPPAAMHLPVRGRRIGVARWPRGDQRRATRDRSRGGQARTALTRGSCARVVDCDANDHA